MLFFLVKSVELGLCVPSKRFHEISHQHRIICHIDTKGWEKAERKNGEYDKSRWVWSLDEFGWMWV